MSEYLILVVEDERIVANGIKSDLENFGFHVSGIAASAEEAVEMAVRDRPDLVLMDIHLGGERDGVDAAREIQARSGIPVVYLSAFADAETIARAKETEAFGYLLKPYEEWELLTTIEMAIARHDAEQRLAATEHRLAAILEGIDDAVIAADAENQINFMNSASNALTGWSKDDAIGASIANVYCVEEEKNRIAIDELANKAIREGCVVDLPVATRIIGKDLAETPVEGSLCPIYDSQGKSLGTVLTLRSTSARIELERFQHQTEKQTRLSQKMEAVRRLAGGVGHHLNNLLTVIMGNTSLALSHPSCDDKIAETLERVDAASHRAAAQIERLLLFSGRGRVQLKQVDLNKVLFECLNEVSPLLAREIHTSYRPGSDLWPVIIDEEQVDQALMNVCLNSQGATLHRGQLTVESKNVTLVDEDVEKHPGARVGNFVRVRISNDSLEEIPEFPTGALDPQLLSAEPGYGPEFGLAFVAAVMEQHHGWIECKSDLGMGTWFDLYFPSFGMESSEETIESEKPLASNSTILLAESDVMLRSVGQLILEEQGYQVLVAEDGVQAVAIFQQSPEHIDLAIIDLNLPRLTGEAVFKQLMELDPNVEVLFSSDYFAAEHYEGTGHLAGIIRKPYSRQKFVEMVQLALERHADKMLSHGRVTKICQPDDSNQSEHGYGVISTCDGREVYFDADSLVDVEFQRLEIYSEVQFIELKNSDRPKATTVWLMGKQQHLVA